MNKLKDGITKENIIIIYSDETLLNDLVAGEPENDFLDDGRIIHLKHVEKYCFRYCTSYFTSLPISTKEYRQTNPTEAKAEIDGNTIIITEDMGRKYIIEVGRQEWMDIFKEKLKEAGLINVAKEE